jgi:hypothetical protein
MKISLYEATKNLEAEMVAHKNTKELEELEIELIYSQLKKSANPQEIFPFKDLISVSMESDAEIAFNRPLLTATLTVPSISEETFQLFKASPLPVITNDIISLIDIKQKFLVFHEILGVTGMDDINGCIPTFDGFLICKLLQPVTKTNLTCLSAAFLENSWSQYEKFINHAKIKSTAAIRLSAIRPSAITAQCDKKTEPTFNIDRPTLISSMHHEFFSPKVTKKTKIFAVEKVL